MANEMHIDKNEILNKLSGMSDDELKDVVSSIADALGVNPHKTQRTLNDIGKIKDGIMSMSQREFDMAASMLDQDSLNEIKQKLDM